MSFSGNVALRTAVLQSVGDPTLTLHYRFAATTSLTPIEGPAITFTRASNGTFFDSSSIIQTAANDVARFTHDPSDNTSLGLLIEVTRANLQIRSEEFDNSSWIKNEVTLAANDIVAPDGNTTAENFTDTIVSGSHIAFDGVTLAANTDGAFSMFARPGTKDFVHLNFQNAANNYITGVYDLSAGAGSASETSVGGSSGTLALTPIVDAGNGWFRTIMAGQIAPTNGSFFLGPAELATGNTFAATGEILYVGSVQDVHLWGAQLELGSFPTSYIPTGASTVTRANDVNSATVTSLIAAANTMVVSARTGYDAGVVWQIDDGTENERYRIERNASNEIHVIVTDGGAGQADLNLGAVADQTDFKVAVRLAASDFAASLDGAAVVTDTSGTLPTVTTSRFGMDTAGDEWNSTIAEAKLFNVGKSNSDLQAEAA